MQVLFQFMVDFKGIGKNSIELIKLVMEQTKLRRSDTMTDIKFEIIETISVLSESPRGWKKELNLISWNDKEPKYDLRDWSPDHSKMGKGITLTKEELEKLKDILDELMA